MKASKARKRLEVRIADFQATIQRLQRNGDPRWKGYRKPGSLNRKGGATR